MKTLVIVPTYNEIENIQNLIPAIKSECPDVHVLVVDDSSPDGTAHQVEKMSKNSENLFLLLRPKKQGLGRAYIDGFKWGLQRDYELLVEMDADFSHRPCDLRQLIKVAEENDFVIGSRYVLGGKTANWGLIRKIISRGGSIYSKIILGYSLNDWTGGFNAWKAHVLNEMGLDRVKSNGYCFQIELKFRACRLGFKYKEVPITFEDRRVGESKMSLKIVLEAFYRVWMLRFLK